MRKIWGFLLKFQQLAFSKARSSFLLPFYFFPGWGEVVEKIHCPKARLRNTKSNIIQQQNEVSNVGVFFLINNTLFLSFWAIKCSKKPSHVETIKTFSHFKGRPSRNENFPTERFHFINFEYLSWKIENREIVQTSSVVLSMKGGPQKNSTNQLEGIWEFNGSPKQGIR